MLSPVQYGFRQAHCEEIHCRYIYIDIQKAYDTVNHLNLLKKVGTL